VLSAPATSWYAAVSLLQQQCHKENDEHALGKAISHTNCERLSAESALVYRDELAKITNVLDEKVPTFFLQPTSYKGERRKPFAFLISPLQWCRFLLSQMASFYLTP
jgi:hypothetical protein